MTGSWWGAWWSIAHDAVLTPLDVAKQRMQLGAHKSCAQCVQYVLNNEGFLWLYRSFPVTLFTNLPYSGFLVWMNETLKSQLLPVLDEENGSGSGASATARIWSGSQGGGWGAAGTNAAASAVEQGKTDAVADARRKLPYYLLFAGLSAGAASIGTQPLDVIKTRIQTQHCLIDQIQKPTVQIGAREVPYKGFFSAGRKIVADEGFAWLYRGLVPRLFVTVPAAAISWGSYEMTKSVLLKYFGD